MKVMLLMWSDGSYAGGGAAEDYAAWAAYEASLREDGVYVESGQFADTGDVLSLGTSLAASNTGIHVSSPSQKAGHSALVGYYLLDCPDHGEAVRHASRAPLYGSVEVRDLAQY